jgi:hypothetical protein
MWALRWWWLDMGALSGLSGGSAMSGLLPVHNLGPVIVPDNTVSVDFAAAGTAVNRKIYGLNAYQALNPAVTTAAAYKSAIGYLSPAMIRIHSLEMMKDSTSRPLGWVKTPTTAAYAWDVPKIRAALTGFFPSIPKILCICRFPAFLSDSAGKLLPGKSAEFAAFCVQLVTIAMDCNTNVSHINLLNEFDVIYNNAFAELGAIWNTARDAIKAAFPSVGVGGHSFSNIYGSTNVNAYLAVCKNKIDFFCFNAYTTGNPAATTQQQIWNSASNAMKDAISNAKSRLNAYGVPNIPVFATEMGMLYLSAPNPLNTGAKRMVWEAIRLMKTLSSAAEFIGCWTCADDWHGVFSSPSSSYQARPSAHLYHAFNSKMIGVSYPATVVGSRVTVVGSTPVLSVMAMACDNAGKKSIAIVNRSELDRIVNLKLFNSGINLGTLLDIKLVTASGLQSTAISYRELDRGYLIPMDSILIISETTL